MDKNSLFSTSHQHAVCPMCGEEFTPDIAIHYSTRWECLRCETTMIVKRIATTTYGVRLPEER
ncbi:MAG: hypothetical protein JSS77_15960 [Acidobacteria bacterium]|nr:hypothetical protein [Acidobacteriota bacterium]